ncbi:MAG: hypothetical protein M1831_000736 [Alyxoria varia]|nr:MAG: hypothetical protein M1831_000736 [Alyxoria varia]
MAGTAALLIAYIFGGVTLLPLLFILGACHAYFVLPPEKDKPHRSEETIRPEERNKELEEKLAPRGHEPDAAAGYFAVCREYVPGGVNGKPPERTTPAGETITAESPSVYQSMYRSIFDRGKTQSPSIEAGKPIKKARNVFYVVLRHNHLVLFDNSEQLAVRHVISLAHHDVDIYSGGEEIPEGELWIKRNCIRLRKKPDVEGEASSAMPFFLFCENCSEKEDFYHTLLHNQGQDPTFEPKPPKAQLFKTDDMIKLIRGLHVSAEEYQQTRWLNAALGRIFLSLYQTPEVEDFIRTKISKKMDRVPKPAFVKSIRLENLDMGDSAPFFTNPKLREMTVDGALTVEADVRYNGNFNLMISALARLELGSRFKAREVSILLAGKLQKLEGHLLMKIKPPPSNRIWMSFEAMPKLDIVLEPVVSSRQITYGVILRAIESRLREVIGETVVLPNWDDLPFTYTERQQYRGGIWTQDKKEPDLVTTATEQELFSESTEKDDSFDTDSIKSDATGVTGTRSVSGTPAPNTTLSDQEPEQQQSSHQRTHSSSFDKDKPKAMRSNSFATAASPVVSKSPATIEAAKRQAVKGHKDATSAMKNLSSRSPDQSPMASPVREPVDDRRARKGSVSLEKKTSLNSLGPTSIHTASLNGSQPTADDTSKYGASEDTPSTTDPTTPPHQKMAEAISTARSIPKQPGPEKAKTFNASVGNATAAARNWGLNVLQGKTPIIPGASSSSSSTSNAQQQQPETKRHQRERSVSSSPAQPMGRGQPLPPPGQPLPKPERGGWSAGGVVSSLRRKPVSVGGGGNNGNNNSHPEVDAMARTRSASSQSAQAHTPSKHHVSTSDPMEDLVMRVDAPQESGSSTPTEEKRDGLTGLGRERGTGMVRSASAQGLEAPTPAKEGERDVEKLKESESVPGRLADKDIFRKPETAYYDGDEDTNATRFTSSSGDIT